MNPNKRRFLAATLALGLSLTFAGQTVRADSADDDRERLLQRAQAYWQARKDNDGVSAWNYEEISLDPRWTLQSYLKRGAIVHDDASVLDVVRIDGDEGVVRVRVRYSLPALGLKKHEAEFDDRWKRIRGQWYHAEQQAQ